MTENHPTLGLFNGKPIFGIKKFEIFSGLKEVVIKNCKDGDEGNTNRWEIVDNRFSDIWTPRQYGWERDNQLSSANRLLSIVNTLVILPQQIEKDVLMVYLKF